MVRHLTKCERFRVVRKQLENITATSFQDINYLVLPKACAVILTFKWHPATIDYWIGLEIIHAGRIRRREVELSSVQICYSVELNWSDKTGGCRYQVREGDGADDHQRCGPPSVFLHQILGILPGPSPGPTLMPKR